MQKPRNYEVNPFDEANKQLLIALPSIFKRRQMQEASGMLNQGDVGEILRAWHDFGWIEPIPNKRRWKKL